jgi:hypothetical protein
VLCGEIVSDGCPVLDDQGNETNEMNFTPCGCSMATYPPVNDDKETSIHAEIDRLSIYYPIDYIVNNDIFEKDEGNSWLLLSSNLIIVIRENTSDISGTRHKVYVTNKRKGPERFYFVDLSCLYVFIEGITIGAEIESR